MEVKQRKRQMIN